MRQSQDGRLTLVLHDAADPVPSLWAQMKVDTLDDAVKALAEREGSPGKPLSNPRRDIGRWPDDRRDDPKTDPANIVGLPMWAAERHIDYVIWTALWPRFNNIDGHYPTTKEDAVAYLRNLSEGQRAKAGSTCDTRLNRSVRPIGNTWPVASGGDRPSLIVAEPPGCPRGSRPTRGGFAAVAPPTQLEDL